MRNYECQSFSIVINRIITPRLLSVCVGLFVLGVLLPGSSAVAQNQPIGLIADLMGTPRDQAAQRNPVRVRGTVSLVADGITSQVQGIDATDSFCIEDQSAGIWIRAGHAIREGVFTDDHGVLLKLDVGVDVEMEGFVDAAAYAPVILPSRITILGSSELPDAPRAVMRRFLNGADELRRVKVIGVAQNIVGESDQWWSVRVETGVGHFVTRLPKKDQFAPFHFLDTKIELTGLAAGSWNWRSEYVCPRLILSSEEDIRILQPAPADPFSVKKVSLETLDGYSPLGRPLHRRRIEGTVTYYDGNDSLYVQENGLGIYVQLTHSKSLQIGDRVVVSGFIDTTRYLAGLCGAHVRRLERGEPPAPVPMTTTQIINEHRHIKLGQPTSMRSCDGKLIQLSGQLLSFELGTLNDPHRLELDCGDSVTTAYLLGDMTAPLTGTELQLTGIANLVFAAPVATANLAKPNRVDLLLRDADDIVVLSRPSWWTAQRVFAVLAIVASLALAAFFWAISLRGSLIRRTDQLALEMKNRRDVAIEFQGAITERTRLAANLHDTLLQTMAGIAYQIEACGQFGGRDKSTFQSHLDTASQMIQHGQEDLRNTVWAMHSLPLTQGMFADSVREIARKFVLGTDVNIDVKCASGFPALADFVAGNLLLVVQESIHNAIKHASASNIDIDLGVTAEADRVTISVTDNGNGFDMNTRLDSSDGHFGIEGMTQRIERLGGTMQFESQCGIGTAISLSVPLKEFDPKIT